MKSESEFIKCSQHPNKLAKKFCNKCNDFICNACAVDSHSDHIQNLVKLNTLYINNREILEKFVVTMNLDFKLNSSLTFKCMNFVFHEGKYICLECKKFLCEKCLPTHDIQHSMILIKNYIENLREKIEIFMSFIYTDSPPVLFNQLEYNFNTITTSIHENFDKNVTEKIFEIRENFKSIFMSRKNLQLNIFADILNFYNKKENFIANHKTKFEEMKKIHDRIKFEKEIVRIYEIFLEFEKIIDNLINDKEISYFKNLIENFKTLNSKINESYKKFDQKINLFNELLENELLNRYNILINEEQENFKIDIIKLLNITESQYYEYQSTKEKMSSYNNNLPEITNSDFHDKEVFKINSIEIKKFNPLRKEYESQTLQITSENEIYLLREKKEKNEYENENKNSNNNQPKIFKIINFSISYINNIVPNNILIDKTDLKNNRENDDEEEDLSEVFSSSSVENVEETTVSDSQQFTEAIENSNLNNINIDVNKNIKIVEKDYSQSIENNNNTNSETNSNENKILTNMTKNEIETENISNQNNNAIDTESLALNKKLDLITTKLEKYDESETNNSTPNKRSSIIKELLTILTWEERNYIELISIGYNCQSTFIYNSFYDTITEVDFSKFKFPAFHCYLNILPWVYVSGGKDNKTSKDLNNFFKIRRNNEKDFEYVELKSMQINRSYHTMVSHNNFIYAISGTRNLTCERYDTTLDAWTPLPNLNSSREKACACIHDNKYLYVFLGFDRTINKYVSNFERLDISLSNKFEVLNVKGIQNLLKKQAMSHFYKGGEIYLIGGVNALRNETKEVFHYDFKSNSISMTKTTMTSNYSFNHSQFVKLSADGILYNFSENFDLIKLDCKNMKFI